MKYGEIIKFEKSKELKYIKNLGKGGGGETHLFIDEVVDMQFAIKKYNPIEENRVPGHFQRFVDEVKILYKLSHSNIVRIYNSFIYPVSETGYIQMEYIEGVPIDQYDENSRSKNWEQIFLALIEAFQYLEKNRILHRDIKPQNILIDNNDLVKIIDFGFSKCLKPDESKGKSVVLNANAYPSELLSGEGYSVKTEIFYLGWLLTQIFDSKKIKFRYEFIIKKMIQNKIDLRYNSFEEIIADISNSTTLIDFDSDVKIIYRQFADELVSKIPKFKVEFNPVEDINSIVLNLGKLISDNSLEEFLQNNNGLIKIFHSGAYQYYASADISMDVIKKFYSMLVSQNINNQKVIISNLINRLSTITVEISEDYPF